MTNYENNNTPEPSRLPLVTMDTVQALSASSTETNKVTMETFQLMRINQPVLAEKISQLVLGVARDEDEQYHMLTAAVTAYKLLDLQAEASRLSDQFGQSE